MTKIFNLSKNLNEEYLLLVFLLLGENCVATTKLRFFEDLLLEADTSTSSFGFVGDTLPESK